MGMEMKMEMKNWIKTVCFLLWTLCNVYGVY